MSNKYLIQIAVGPVQDFISSARKLRDLWFGSKILSELSKCVAKSLAENGCQLIFPFVALDQTKLLERNSDLIVANKILASYEGDKNPADIVDQAKKEWQALLQTIAAETLENIASRLKKIRVLKERFDKQINDVGEFYGVWVVMNDYSIARKEVEKLLAGRKALRVFSQPTWDGQGIPKNSLDGYRETVLSEDSKAVGLLKKGEKLDAIGCIKRFCVLDKKYDKKEIYFLDLSDVAVLPWLNQIENDHADKHRLITYKESIEGCFEEDEKFTSGVFYFTQQDFRELTRAHANVGNEARKIMSFLTKKYGEPNKYACVLMGDGDKMGEMISHVKDPQGHQKFSSLLSEFAAEAREIVKKHDGSLIYAGGDDVLAYAPIHIALDCAKALRDAFITKMKRVVKDLNLSCTPSTFSVGMAIVHHSEPLSNALNTVRQAEREAKEGGRDALAIIQDKRSGAPRYVFGKWEEDGIIKRLKSIMKYYSNDTEEGGGLASRIGYQLKRAEVEGGDKLTFEKANGRLIPQNAQSAMVLRILQHKDVHNSVTKELEAILLKQKKISTLSQELIVAYQFAISSPKKGV